MTDPLSALAPEPTPAPAEPKKRRGRPAKTPAAASTPEAVTETSIPAESSDEAAAEFIEFIANACELVSQIARAFKPLILSLLKSPAERIFLATSAQVTQEPTTATSAVVPSPGVEPEPPTAGLFANEPTPIEPPPVAPPFINPELIATIREIKDVTFAIGASMDGLNINMRKYASRYASLAGFTPEQLATATVENLSLEDAKMTLATLKETQAVMGK